MPPHPHDYPARDHNHPDPITQPNWETFKQPPPPEPEEPRLTAEQRRHCSVLEAALDGVTGDGRRRPVRAPLPAGDPRPGVPGRPE